MTARDRYLVKTYGITEADYDVLLEAGNGACWICHRRPKKQRLHVEHDHITKRIRGLACYRCNTMLQHANDKPAILRRAADYLESTLALELLERNKDD